MSLLQKVISKLKGKDRTNGGWKKFKTRDGKVVEFFVPLRKRRKRRYCPTCKTTFNVCPFEEKNRLVHHYYCSNRCEIINGLCKYTYISQQTGIKVEPPTCGTIVGKHRKCSSCLHFRKRKNGGYCKKLNVYVLPSTNADDCPHYINRTHKNT